MFSEPAPIVETGITSWGMLQKSELGTRDGSGVDTASMSPGSVMK